jgi:hypothetical protein
MVKILTIEGKNVRTLDKNKFVSESDLQDYLEKYPSIIPIEDIYENASQLTCIGREVPVASGAIDLLYIDQEGILTIVETKLAKNPEIRRTVIGQLIEYASFVSQWKAEYIYDMVTNRLKQPIDMSAFGYMIFKKSEDDFKHNIEENLKNGRIHLIIAVDELNESLRSTITFLNTHSNFDIFLLQISSYEESKDKKVLIPSIFGYAQKTPGNPRQSKIDENIFIDRCQENQHNNAVAFYKKAKELANRRAKNGDFINFGVSGYSYRLPWKGKPNGETIFTGYSDGKIMVWPDLLSRTGETGQKYMGKLRNIAVLTNEFSRNKYPTISTDKMKVSDIDSFFTILEELGDSLDDLPKGVTS